MNSSNDQEIVKYQYPDEHKKDKNEKPRTSTEYYEVVDGALREVIPSPSPKQKGQKPSRRKSRDNRGEERYYEGTYHDRNIQNEYDYGYEDPRHRREGRGRSRSSHHTRAPQSHYDDYDYDGRYSSEHEAEDTKYSRHRSRGRQPPGPEFITERRGATTDFAELKKREKAREQERQRRIRELEKEIERERRKQEEWEREERRREKEQRALERELERIRGKEQKRERMEKIRQEKKRWEQEVRRLEKEQKDQKERERLARNAAPAGPGSSVSRDRGIEVDERDAYLEYMEGRIEQEKMRAEAARNLLHNLNLRALKSPLRSPRPPRLPQLRPG